VTILHPQAPKVGPDRHGLIRLPEDAFADAFAQKASAEEQAHLAAVQRVPRRARAAHGGCPARRGRRAQVAPKGPDVSDGFRRAPAR
jgi:hypothetical protein